MRIHTEIDIDAPADRVWEILTNFAEYPSWNPMIPKLTGQLSVGARLNFQISVNRRLKVPISVELITADAPRELRWVGPRFSPLRRILSGSHYFKIDEMDDARVRFTHGEDFEGLAIPTTWRRAEKAIAPMYAALNRALKHRAETSQYRH